MKAFVVGNIATDETFGVARLPVEGESIFGSKISTDLGGKGANQATILGRSGVQTILIAAIGTDAQAKLLRNRLAAEPVTQRLIEMSDQPSDSTIVVKERSGRNVVITTVDCARSLKSDDVASRMSDALPGDLLVLQGNLELTTTKQIIAVARERSLRIVLNPSPFEHEIKALLADLNALFVNQHEALEITGFTGHSAVQALLQYNIETVVLSLGEKGALLGTKSGILTVSARSCDAIDSTGAGDTLQGVALASAILRRKEIDLRALEIATNAASLTVSRAGTTAAFPTGEELSDLLAQ